MTHEYAKSVLQFQNPAPYVARDTGLTAHDVNVELGPACFIGVQFRQNDHIPSEEVSARAAQLIDTATDPGIFRTIDDFANECVEVLFAKIGREGLRLDGYQFVAFDGENARRP